MNQRFVFAVLLLSISIASADEPKKDDLSKKPQWQRLLQGNDAKKADELSLHVRDCLARKNFEDALDARRALYELRKRVQGEDHYQAHDEKWEVIVIGKIAALSAAGRAEWDEAVRRASQARLLEQRGKYREALTAHQAMLQMYQNVLGEEHPRTAASCDSAAVNLKALGKAAEAELLGKKALAIYRKTLGEAHPNTAACYTNLGMTLNAQSNFAEAELLVRRGLAILHETLGEEHATTAMCLKSLAFILSDQGKNAEAESLNRKALTIFRKVLGDENNITATSYANLAVNLGNQGKHAEAEALNKRALAINRKLLGDEHPVTAAGYNNLAFNLADQGRYAEAEPLAERALAIFRKVYGDTHPDTAKGCNNAARILNARGKYSEAEQFCREALEISQKTLGDEHPQTATGFTNLAATLKNQGDYAGAEPLFQKALAIFQKEFGEEHVQTARGYNNLASNLSAQRKWSQAEPIYRRALAIRQKILGDEHPDTAASLNNAAVNLTAQGKFAEAEPLYSKALAIFEKTLGEQHPRTATAYASAAFNMSSQGRLEETLKLLNRCRSSFEASRVTSAGRGADRSSLSGGGNPYPLMAATHARLKSFREAFDALEINLARGLLDELADRRAAAPQTDDATKRLALVEQIDAIEPRIGFLVARQKRSEAEQKELELLLGNRFRLGQQLSELAVAMSKREVAGLEEVQKSLDPDEALVAWIDVTDTHSGKVNEHWGCVLRSMGSPVFERLPGSGEKGEFSNEDIALPARFRALLEKTAAKSEIDALARQLHAQRLAPLDKHLQGAAKLYVIAVNEMAAIPVDVLGDRWIVSYVPSGTLRARLKDRPLPQTSGVLALGDPIYSAAGTKKSATAALPSSGLLVQQVAPGGNAEANGRLKPGDVLLSYAGVDLKTLDDLDAEIAKHVGDKTVAITVWREGEAKPFTRGVGPGKLGVALAKEPAPTAIAKRQKFDGLMASLSRGGDWAELPGTRLELKTLTELFHEKAIVLAGHSASESRLEMMRKQGSLSKVRYLHFASHGMADNARAFDSALVLAQDDPEMQQVAPPGETLIDGRLTAREVLEYWKLDAELVTLSACQTALGRQGGGDGLLGFAQAFLLAGSRSVCLSLWEVDDRATVLLMDRFYRNLLGKREGLDKPMRKAEALAEAKKWLRNLTQDEVAHRLANLSEGVVRGKDQKALPIAAPKLDPKTDPKAFKPFDHPRYWAAFILIGDPS